MSIYPNQRTASVPAWISEVPPLVTCLSCNGDAEKSCTDCSVDCRINHISEGVMCSVADLIQGSALRSSEPVILLQALIWDIETVCDDWGNPYPGTYPYWEWVPSYVKARDYLKQLDNSYDSTI